MLRRDLFNERYDLELHNLEDVHKGGPYDLEMYRIPTENKKVPLMEVDVTDQLLNSPLALRVGG